MRSSQIVLFLFLCSGLFAQNPWTLTKEAHIPKSSAQRQIVPQRYVTFSLDFSQIQDLLADAPDRFSPDRDAEAVILSLPMPDGQVEEFYVYDSPVMHPDLAAKFPEIRTFLGRSISTPGALAYLDYTPAGFHGMILSPKGSIFIDPYAKGDTEHYVVYHKRDHHPDEDFSCQFDAYNKMPVDEPAGEPEFAGDCQLRRYRLALACTGEYAQFHGGTVPLALAAMVTSLNRVNGLFERDASITMQLAAGNEDLVFLNGGTDPYSNNDGGAMLDENIATCNAIIGEANYDIGHVFSTGGGGVAFLNSPCSEIKAGGVTGLDTPVGDPFDVDYVAHEMGHQYGGRHTQNNNCNRDNQSSYEPGSASTIMGYAGICPPDIQPNSDDYFHGNSIILFGNFVTGAGNSCAEILPTDNTPPIAIAGDNYTIPGGTPFGLFGFATDNEDQLNLTYCWEQYDKEVGPQPPQPTNTVGPVFRSLDPTPFPFRTFPNPQAILNNLSPTWEVLPQVSRTLNFKLTVRDNFAGSGCTDDDDMVVSVNGLSGPFEVTFPNEPDLIFSADASVTVTWDVAGSDQAPVNAEFVDVYLIVDGDFLNPVAIANGIANDGSETFTVPNVPTTAGRIGIRGTGNIFFDISNFDFTIIGTGVMPCEPWTPEIVTTTDTSATIGWIPQVNGLEYFIRYREIGDTSWTILNEVFPPFVITGLSPATNYEFQAQTSCADGVSDWSETVYNFTTQEPPVACVAWEPETIETTSTMAIITWQPVPGATKYAIRYRPVGSTIWSRALTTTTQFTLSGLNPETTYEFITRTFCPDGWTAWTQFPYEFATQPEFGPGNPGEFKLEFDLSPNPVSGVVQIIPRSGVASAWTLIDATGNILLTGVCQDGYAEIDLSGVLTGMYFVKLTNDSDAPGVERLIKN